MKRTAVYPGTFDPITTGHQDLVRRAASIFDRVVVAIAANPNKTPMFPLEKRVELAARVLVDEPNVQVLGYAGLTVEFARKHNLSVVIRGLRAVSDFEYEFQMVAMNQRLNTEIETVFLMADPRHQAIASRLVKEIALLGGDVSAFTTPAIAEALVQRCKEQK